jgi:hypothetical protein
MRKRKKSKANPSQPDGNETWMEWISRYLDEEIKVDIEVEE